MTTQTTVKSGKGIKDGVVSELAAFFTVKPGHEDQLRAACEWLAVMCRQADPKAMQKTGLRDSRHVIFDNGQRLLWATTFETDWDPYVDDALIVLGMATFVDWMQHTVEGDSIIESMQDTAGIERLGKASTAEIEQFLAANTGELKRILQSAQAPAAGYFNPLADQTMSQLKKALRVERAFEQVLDDPAAAQALQHPALQPLLEEAAG